LYCTVFVCVCSVITRDDLHLGRAVFGGHGGCVGHRTATEEGSHTHPHSWLVNNWPTFRRTPKLLFNKIVTVQARQVPDDDSSRSSGGQWIVKSQIVFFLSVMDYVSGQSACRGDLVHLCGNYHVDFVQNIKYSNAAMLSGRFCYVLWKHCYCAGVADMVKLVPGWPHRNSNESLIKMTRKLNCRVCLVKGNNVEWYLSVPTLNLLHVF